MRAFGAPAHTFAGSSLEALCPPKRPGCPQWIAQGKKAMGGPPSDELRDTAEEIV